MPNQAITILENAGKHLVRTRKLQRIIRTGVTASAAAKHSNPEVQSLAILSVLLARVVCSEDAEWVTEVCEIFSIKEGA